ncbi:hypothetical protein ACJJTC_000133 [Scirpophaga incertulas]
MGAPMDPGRGPAAISSRALSLAREIAVCRPFWRSLYAAYRRSLLVGTPHPVPAVPGVCSAARRARRAQRSNFGGPPSTPRVDPSGDAPWAYRCRRPRSSSRRLRAHRGLPSPEALGIRAWGGGGLEPYVAVVREALHLLDDPPVPECGARGRVWRTLCPPRDPPSRRTQVCAVTPCSGATAQRRRPHDSTACPRGSVLGLPQVTDLAF